MPEKKLGVVILTNGDEVIGPVRKLNDAAFDLLLEALHGESLPPPIKPLEIIPAELLKYAGEYESDSYWATLKVAPDKNRQTSFASQFFNPTDRSNSC